MPKPLQPDTATVDRAGFKPPQSLLDLEKKFWEHVAKGNLLSTGVKLTIRAAEDTFGSSFYTARSKWRNFSRDCSFGTQCNMTRRLVAIVDAVDKGDASVDCAGACTWEDIQKGAEAFSEDLRDELRHRLTDYLYLLQQHVRLDCVDEAFPAHIAQITALVERYDDIRIACDAADYGSFRDFDLHLKLVAAILSKSKKEGSNVRLLIYDAPRWLSGMNAFRWSSYRGDHHRQFKEELRRFLKGVERPLKRRKGPRLTQLWDEVDAFRKGTVLWNVRGPHIEAWHDLMNAYHWSVIDSLEKNRIEMKVFRPGAQPTADKTGGPNETRSGFPFLWIGQNHKGAAVIQARQRRGADGVATLLRCDEDAISAMREFDDLFASKLSWPVTQYKKKFGTAPA